MIRYVQGDSFAPEHLEMWDIIGHQVNARGGFGSGFAAAVAKFSPSAKHAYLRAHKKHGWKLGQVLPVFDKSSGKYILHICGQDAYGSGGPHTDYKALATGLEKFVRITQESGLRPALPLIGCGLAGGEWSRVAPLIETAFEGREVLVFHLEPEPPTL